MKAAFRILALSLFLVAPFSAAYAQAPLLSPIPNVTLNVGATASVNVVAVDVAGRPITLTPSLPSFGTLNAPIAGTGMVVTNFTLSPTSTDAGTYSAAVTAVADGTPSIRVFQITVNASGSDQAPVVTAPALQEVTAGSQLTFTITASDADGDAIGSLITSSLPDGATFTPNGSNTSGVFDWTTGVAHAGEYDVMFTATNALSGAATTHIHVASAPRLRIAPIDDVTVPGGSSVSVPVDATFMNGAVINLTASLPAFAVLNPPGTGTGAVSTTITVSPPLGSAGTYPASVTATSLGMTVDETFSIIVTGDQGPTNRAPVLSAPASETVEVGSTLTFSVTATDPDGDHVDLFGSSVPPGAGFIDSGDNSGIFSWTPIAGQAGSYIASFSGLDNRGGSGSASTSITVTGGEEPLNQPPVLSAPATQTVDEGALLAFTVTASDPDGDHVALSPGPLPMGADFSDQGDNTGAFSWTPGSSQSGAYTVSFEGNDGHGGTGTASTEITVNEVGGGGTTEVPGKACVVGPIKSRAHEKTCFRIRPIEGSFDLRDVILSSITLEYNGQSIPALNDAARIELHCYGRGRGHDGDDRKGNHHAAAMELTGGRPHGDGHHDDDNDRCGGVQCGERGHDDDDKDCDRDREAHGGANCDTLGIRACFSTEAVLSLLGPNPRCRLTEAEIHATLANGATVVATFGKDRPQGDHDGDKDDDKDDGEHHDGDKDGDRDDREVRGREGHGKMNPCVRPNPLNPMTELLFTMSREGQARVTVYDMQGRVVKVLLDQFRSAGQQRLAWDGSNSNGRRVASGVYFFRIQAPEGDVVQRVAVVK